MKLDFFLRKEILVWVVVKRDLWEALDCGLKNEIRFSTKAREMKREISGEGITVSKGTEAGIC